MVVADECRIQEEPNEFYRWSLKRNPPIIKVRKEKQNVSFYGGLSLKTKKVTAHLCDWQNSEETCLFLEEIKKKYEGKGTVLLIWDNASWHKSEKIRGWLKDNPGVIELFNFPPYAPELNPQEHVWKALRDELSDVVGVYTFEEVIDRACLFLRINTFDYKLY